jgi:hypothetical protein
MRLAGLPLLDHYRLARGLPVVSGQRYEVRETLPEAEVHIMRINDRAEILLAAGQLDLREDRIRVDERQARDRAVFIRAQHRARYVEQQISRRDHVATHGVREPDPFAADRAAIRPPIFQAETRHHAG